MGVVCGLLDASKVDHGEMAGGEQGCGVQNKWKGNGRHEWPGWDEGLVMCWRGSRRVCEGIGPQCSMGKRDEVQIDERGRYVVCYCSVLDRVKANEVKIEMVLEDGLKGSSSAALEMANVTEKQT